MARLSDDSTPPVGNGSSVTFTEKGNWATSTAYVPGDTVTQSNIRYVCATAHTSGTFATDLAAGKWVAMDPGASVALSNNTPVVLSTAGGSGTGSAAARDDHAHPNTGLHVTKGYKTANYYGPSGSRPNGSFASFTNGRLVVVYFDVLADSISIDRLSCAKWSAASAGGVARIGWFNVGSDGEPGTLGYEAPSTLDVTGASSPWETAVTTTLPKPGVYLAMLSQGAAATQPQAQLVQYQVSFTEQIIANFSATPDARTRYYDGYTSGALPSTLAGVSPTGYAVGAPLLAVRKA